jgi:membrane-bound lytic murein transglycosylase A
MRLTPRRIILSFALMAGLAGCVTAHRQSGVSGDLARAPGWRQEDHAAALEAFTRTCGVARIAPWPALCREARALAQVSDNRARAFFETRFSLRPCSSPGLLTAYFTPELSARRSGDDEFNAPVRPRGAETMAALAWMRPSDYRLLKRQGSAILRFEDGGAARAVFLTAEGPQGAVFALVPDDGGDPPGAAGAPLPPGRAVAVDAEVHPFGELLWIDSTALAADSARSAFRRLVVALDRGGDIRGESRIDLYLGRGERAGTEARRIKATAIVCRLAPRRGPSR